MSDSFSEPEIDEKFLSAYIELKSRVDALNAMVTLLARHAGADPKKLRTVLATLRQTIAHKYRERVEDQSPPLAARLDQLAESPDVDLGILDQLRFDDEDGRTAL